VSRALDFQKRAVALQPDPMFKLNLGPLYIRSAGKALARAQLDRLAQLGVKSPRQREAAEILGSL